MIIGPKYKIARRLGAPVFEKTQTQKFALSLARREKTRKGFVRPKSEYGAQLLEKQKARFTYCLTEKQFGNYVKKALAKKGTQVANALFESLETRADSFAYRAGFAPTRLAARQMVGHGHMMVNGKRITIPSFALSEGDTLSIRPASVNKPLFKDLEERLKTHNRPAWIGFDADTKTATVQGKPKYESGESLYDINAILEFYSR